MSVFKKIALGLSILALVLTTSAHAQLTKMTIATGVDPGFGAFYVAKVAGIFEKNGFRAVARLCCYWFGDFVNKK